MVLRAKNIGVVQLGISTPNVSSNPRKFLKVQIIESVQCDYNLEGKLWERERYWQCQLFTNTHGMNSVSDLYSTKRKGCRKKMIIYLF